jgi:hypothetical protein
MKNKYMPHVLTAIIAVAVSQLISTVDVSYRAEKAIQHAQKCEKLLIQNKIEPVCAGFLEQIGYDVVLEGSLYTGEPYNSEKAFNIVLNKIERIE